jgi:hypothetical protein
VHTNVYMDETWQAGDIQNAAVVTKHNK